MIVKIYTLSDPRTLENIRYVGKTQIRSTTRYRQHLKAAKSGKHSRVNCWIRTLLKDGVEPFQEIVEEVDFKYWKQTEIYWIEQFRVWGFNLTNICKGGMDSGRSKGFKSTIPIEKRKEMNAKHSTAMKGNNFHIYNSYENKLKAISKAQEVSRKAVVEFDLENNLLNEYLSISDASRKLNISKDRISRVSKNKQYSTGNRIFKFKEDLLKT